MKGALVLLSVFSIATAQQNVRMPISLNCGDDKSNASFEWMYDNGNGMRPLPDVAASPNPINITLEEPKNAGTYDCMYGATKNATYIVGNFTKPSFVVSGSTSMPTIETFVKLLNPILDFIGVYLYDIF